MGGFPGHCKIPGHSGTDFKHRKAFKKVKEFYRKKHRTQYKKEKDKGPIGSMPSQRTYQLSPSYYFIKYGVKLPFFILCVIGFGYFMKSSIGYFHNDLIDYEQMKVTNKEKQEGIAKAKAYNILVSAGFDYLRGNQLNEAQGEFVLALRIKPQGNAANFGLAKTLKKQCELKSLFCKEAKAYSTYLEE